MPSCIRPLVLSRGPVASLCLAAVLVACGGDNTSSAVPLAGAPAAPGTRALDAGAALLQDKPPRRGPQCLPGRFSFLQRPHAGADRGAPLLRHPGRGADPVRDLRWQRAGRPLDGRGVHRQPAPVRVAARSREGPVAQPCARGEVRTAHRARHSPGGGTCADGSPGGHLRQDLAHLAHRPGQGPSTGHAPADDGLHRGRPGRCRHGADAR